MHHAQLTVLLQSLEKSFEKMFGLICRFAGTLNRFACRAFFYAVCMGLEPMTSAVTGRHSNQLN